MRRKITSAIIFLFVVTVGVQSTAAQGIPGSGGLSGFVVTDLVASGGETFTVGTIGGAPYLIRLAPTSAPVSTFGGTFGLPQFVRLSATPRALAVGDIDLDGRLDVVVGEGSNNTGQIEIFSGAFLQSGILTAFDNSDAADLADGPAGNPNNNSIVPITTNNRVASVTLERLNGDFFFDIAFVTTGTGKDASGDSVQVIFSNADSSFGGPVQIATVDLPVDGAQTVAPRLIDGDALNLAPDGAMPDATPDLAVATTTGIHVFVTLPNAVDPLQNPTFEMVQLSATPSLRVSLYDVTRDNLIDVIVLYAGSSDLSIHVANAGGSYGPARPLASVIQP